MITRREAFRLGGATVAALAGAGAVASSCMATPAPAALNPELARLIEVERAAYAAIGDFADTLAEAERAFRQGGESVDARQAYEEACAAEKALCEAERAAFLALISYPVTTLAELRLIMTAAKKTWWDHDGPEEDEFAALMSGIMGGQA